MEEDSSEYEKSVKEKIEVENEKSFTEEDQVENEVNTKMSVFEKEKLPSSFLNEVISESSNTIVLRSNVLNLEDCRKWVVEFGDATRTKWNSRSSKPCAQRFVCTKKFVCHHSGFMKVAAESNKRSFSKNLNCNATINFKVKLDTVGTRKNDSYVQKGLLAVITLYDFHNHNLNTAESLKFLPSSGCKETFFEYFNDGMAIAEACKYHEGILKVGEYKEEDMANRSINPPYRTVQYWYNQWRLLNLDQRTDQGLIELTNASDCEEIIEENLEEKSAFSKSSKIDKDEEEFKEIVSDLNIDKSQTNKIRKPWKRPKFVKLTRRKYQKQKQLMRKQVVLRSAEVSRTFFDSDDTLELKAPFVNRITRDYVSDFKQMKLQESNIVKVVPSGVSALAFLPSTENVIVVAGSTFGHVGFWNVTSDSNPDIFFAHNGLISNLKVNPDNHSQIITSSYDGTLCSGDVERKVFNQIYNVDTECTYFDFVSSTTLLVSQKNGIVSIIDVRNGCLKSENKHECCIPSVKTVSAHPINKNIFLTSDDRGLLKLWDLRKLEEEPLFSVPYHKGSVSSAFFSPVTGNSILTTSDSSLSLFDSTSVEKEIMFKKSIQHNNKHNFQATWLPESENAFVVGSMDIPRQIEVYNGKGNILFCFKDRKLRTVSSVNQFHPSLNILAGADSVGKVFVFMDTNLKF